MPYKAGLSKSLDDISIIDFLQYPIWEWALDEEGVEGQDETWQRPIIDTEDVTDEILYPTITVKIDNSDLVGTGEYDNKLEELSGISIWHKDQWIGLDEVKLPLPIIFSAVPSINGVKDVKFKLMSLSNDAAVRV